MKQEHDELARLIYHKDKSAVSAFHKRLSVGADQDPLNALSVDKHYMTQIDCNSPNYAAIVLSI